MDLSIIREELRGDNYDSPHEFWKDLKIMFNNAKNYTPSKRSRVIFFSVLGCFLNFFKNEIWNSEARDFQFSVLYTA